MKSLAELAAIRDKIKAQSLMKDATDESDTRIVVGMATCGIAAGARPVLNKFVEEIETRGLKNVKIVQTGCIGMCRLEPIVEIFVPGKDKVTYVKVHEEMVGRIVTEHVVNGQPVTEYLIKE